jgi:pimeloyl-ACP methyl ester carboxylesterase
MIRSRAPVEPAIAPVVFIPGMLGSRLVTRAGDPIWPEGSKAGMARLTLDRTWGRRFLGDDVIAKSVLEETEFRILPDKTIYKPNLDALRNAANFPGGEPYKPYSADAVAAFGDRQMLQVGDLCPVIDPSATLFPFPYDWRRSLGETAELLRRYVKCVRLMHPGKPVHMIAHSMGGLLARRFVLEHPGQVDLLVTVGTPMLGAPKAINVMEKGDMLGGTQRFVIDPSLLAVMSEQFPGAHQLLPSRRYFDLAAEEEPPVGPSPYAAARDPRNYAAFKAEFAARKERKVVYGNSSRGVRGQYFGNSELFWNLESLADRAGQVDWRQDGSQVQYRHVVATGLDTIIRVHIYDDLLHKDVLDALLRTIPEDVLDTSIPPAREGNTLVFRYTTGIGRKVLIPDAVRPVYSPDGDGTVPLLSARRITDQQNLNEPRAEIFRVPEDGEREHTKMLGDPDVVNFILSALRPWEVTRTEKVRQHSCTGGQCAP